uniref:Uncharacterized protein n=1 Tax=Tetraselmis sp. GSL018 TaxID=582737 RepID=A0A061QUY0_9CHLO
MGICYAFDRGASRLRAHAALRRDNSCVQVFARMWDVVLFALYVAGILLDVIVFVLLLLLPFTVVFLLAGLAILGATCCRLPIDIMHWLSEGWREATRWYVNLLRPEEPEFADWGLECLLRIANMRRLPGAALPPIAQPNDAESPLLHGDEGSAS